MMYYSIITSFCLLGMASSQSIISLTACLTKEQNLTMNCRFTPLKQSTVPVTCTYEVDKKVVASSNNTKLVDNTFKNRGTVTINSDVCELMLKGFADDQPKMFNCTIQQDKSVTKGTLVEKKKLELCSSGKILKQSGVLLLLAFILSLLSGMM